MADAITLRDGVPLLGQVAERSPGGVLTVRVRRAWAEANVPDWYALWHRLEIPVQERVLGERRNRLEQWQRDRQRGEPPGRADRLLAAIERARPGSRLRCRPRF